MKPTGAGRRLSTPRVALGDDPEPGGTESGLGGQEGGEGRMGPSPRIQDTGPGPRRPEPALQHLLGDGGSSAAQAQDDGREGKGTPFSEDLVECDPGGIVHRSTSEAGGDGPDGTPFEVGSASIRDPEDGGLERAEP